MAADVGPRLEGPATLAQHDDTVGAELEGDIVSGLRDLADVTGDLPTRPEDPLVLEPRHLRMVVDPGRQSARDRVDRGRDRAGGGGAHRASPAAELQPEQEYSAEFI